jgi:hypothetical protein
MAFATLSSRYSPNPLDFGLDALQLADDPAVDARQLHRRRRVEAAVPALGVHQHEAGRVPQLVAEVAVALAALQVEVDVAAEGGVGGHREAQGVGAVGGDAVGEMLADLGGDLRRVLGPAQPGGVLPDQRLQADAVDDVDRVERVAFGLDILRPSASRTMPWMYTSLNGTGR